MIGANESFPTLPVSASAVAMPRASEIEIVETELVASAIRLMSTPMRRRPGRCRSRRPRSIAAPICQLTAAAPAVTAMPPSAPRPAGRASRTPDDQVADALHRPAAEAVAQIADLSSEGL